MAVEDLLVSCQMKKLSTSEVIVAVEDLLVSCQMKKLSTSEVIVAVEAILLLVKCNHRYFYNDQCKYRSRNMVVDYTSRLRFGHLRERGSVPCRNNIHISVFLSLQISSWTYPGLYSGSSSSSPFIQAVKRTQREADQ